MDCGFPVITYTPEKDPREWGFSHGEQWRDAIQELVAIRKNLMRERNPGLDVIAIDHLAGMQANITRRCYPELMQEFEGIAAGAGLSLVDLVILNNYTDFRDISVDDQGCSVAYVNDQGQPVVGQTWDMHGSAKRYVCCVEVPCSGYEQPAVFFSLVGCLGMMGHHPSGRMVGVNNINTDKARAGLIWPALIRGLLQQPDHAAMARHLAAAPVTSGHAYLLASLDGGEFWEVMPDLAEQVSQLPAENDGYLFHTNHCLGSLAKRRETPIGQNSTTHIRYELLSQKISEVRTFDDMYLLMNDHENYPKSICSNFQTDSQDPSITCGGSVGDLKRGRVVMWRGDEQFDENFVKREFDMGVPCVA
jgi:isopenicillin-N N-acyltransferase-like protein